MVRAQLKPILDSLKNNCPSPSWYGPHLVNEIELEWAETKSKRNEQRVVIYPKGEMHKWISFKPLHRHQSRYRMKQVARVQRLVDYCRRARYFITFTVDPKRFDNDRQAHDGLKEAWNKIRKRLHRINPDVQGITATEEQKQGQPHMHVILWNIHIPKYLKWASNTYPISAGWIDIQPIRAGNKGAVSYLAKYLGKSARNDFTLACLSRWKARTLNIFGKELREFLGPLIQKNSTGEWEKWCFVRDYYDACKEMGEEMAEAIYYPLEKGPPPPEYTFICA